MNEGNIGLIRAAKTYNNTKGFKFIFHAVRYARAAIMEVISEHLRRIRLPIEQTKSIWEFKVKEQELAQTL